MPGEKLTTLDGVVRDLAVEDMVICDAGLPSTAAGAGGTPVSLAAVMGGETSEVLPSTTNVLFEAAHWDPVMVGPHRPPAQAVQRGGQALGARRRPGAGRWSRWTGPCELLAGTAVATAAPQILDIDHAAAPQPILLPVELPSRRIGVPYPPAQVAGLLERVGCTVTPAEAPVGEPTQVPAVDGGLLSVVPPTWRPDLTDPADLVEEVVRLDGYAGRAERAAGRARPAGG